MDGQVRIKSTVGRWPSYRDDSGEPLGVKNGDRWLVTRKHGLYLHRDQVDVNTWPETITHWYEYQPAKPEESSR